MYAAIVSLILVSLIFLIGFGKRVLKTLGIGVGRMMLLLLATTATAVIPPYFGQGYILNYLGIWLTIVSLFLIFRRKGRRDIGKVLIGSIAVAGIALAYRYFAAGIWDTLYGEILYPIVIILSAYIISGNCVRIITNITFGVGIANLVMGLVPYFNMQEVIVGGNGEVILLSIIIAILLSEIIKTIDHAIRPRRSTSANYEAGEDNFDQDSIDKLSDKYSGITTNNDWSILEDNGKIMQAGEDNFDIDNHEDRENFENNIQDENEKPEDKFSKYNRW